MKTSRRGFFGISIGAAVAGPGAAKSVLKDGSVTSPVISSGQSIMTASSLTGGYWDDSDDEATPETIKRYIANATAERNNVLAGRDAHWHGFYLMRDIGIDNLRSVSRVNKARMILERREREQAASRVSHIDKAIAKMKKRLGILGEFI